MSPQLEVTRAAWAVRVIHGALMAGLGMAAIVFVVLRQSNTASIVNSLPISFALSALTIIMVAAAVRILAPMVGQRASEQAPDAFWGDLARRNAAIMLWGTLEGAALIGLVTFYLTGRLAPVCASAVAIGALMLWRPGRFEDA